MTKDEIARLEAELETLTQAARDAREAQREKEGELRDAQIAYAQANPHPWIGKQVQHTTISGYGSRRKEQRRTGTVVAYDPSKHRGLRGLSYALLTPGAPFVVSRSGQSGWRLDDGKDYRWKMRPGETAFAPIEGEEK